MRRRILLCLCLATSVAGLCGCDPQFDAHGPRMNPNSITSPLQWSISGTDEFKSLRSAIDGLTVTEAVTRSDDYRNATFVLDLSRPCIFNTVVLVHGQKEMGFARSVTIDTSNDGKNWTRRYRGSGTRKISYFCLMSPVTARYIRLTADRSGRQPWVISQIYLQ